MSTVTAPPVPSCLVMTHEPSAASSASGKPSGRAVEREALEAGEVAAGRLGAALEDVADDDGAGQLVVLLGRPAEVGDRRADDERGVGDASGDDDVGALGESRGDAEAAEVGVGGQGALGDGVAAQVVALDVGDGRVEAEAAGDLAQLVGEPGGVEAAGVADDRDAALEREPEAVLDLADEGARVAEARVLHRVLAEDQHGELGEVVAGEDVEALAVTGALDHLAHRGQAVAVEAGAVADAERLSHGAASLGSRPPPAGPAKHWAMSSHASAPGPSATRSVSARWTRWVASRQKS